MTVAFFDDRATLTQERPTRYALGPPGAPLVTFNAVDDHGCAWVVDEPEGWDAPTIATGSDPQPQGHGSWLGESFYEQRSLSFTEGLCTAPTAQELQLARRRLLRALTGQLSGLVQYTHLDEAPPRSLWVRPAGKPRLAIVDDRAMTYSFVLVAEDPFKRGELVTYGPITMRQAGAVPGRRYPRRYGRPTPRSRDYGGGEASTAVTLDNVGDEDSHTLYRVHGPIDRPLLLFPQVRRQLGLDLRLGVGDVAIADTRTGLVQLNGVNRFDALTAGSSLPLIPPGGLIVELRSLAGTSWPDAQAYVETAPTWL